MNIPPRDKGPTKRPLHSPGSPAKGKRARMQPPASPEPQQEERRTSGQQEQSFAFDKLSEEMRQAVISEVTKEPLHVAAATLHALQQASRLTRQSVQTNRDAQRVEGKITGQLVSDFMESQRIFVTEELQHRLATVTSFDYTSRHQTFPLDGLRLIALLELAPNLQQLRLHGLDGDTLWAVLASIPPRHFCSLRVLDFAGSLLTNGSLQILDTILHTAAKANRQAEGDARLPMQEIRLRGDPEENTFDPNFLSFIARLPRLNHLALDDMQLTDDAIASLCKTVRLKTLSLGGNAITDVGLRSILMSQGTSIQTLQLDGNALGKKISYHTNDELAMSKVTFAQAPNLTSLDLGYQPDINYTWLRDMQVPACHKLQSLNLAGTRHADMPISFLAAFTQLRAVGINTVFLVRSSREDEDDTYKRLTSLKNIRLLYLHDEHLRSAMSLEPVLRAAPDLQTLALKDVSTLIAADFETLHKVRPLPKNLILAHGEAMSIMQEREFAQLCRTHRMQLCYIPQEQLEFRRLGEFV